MLSRPMIDRIAFFGVSWYAILIVAAIVIGALLAGRAARREGLPPDLILDFLLLAIPLGIAFARAYYVFYRWDDYSEDLVSILFIHEGGLAIYGGILGGLLAAYLACRHHRVPFPKLLDILAPSLALGQAIGRWGNYINMEAYGLRISEEALQFFPFAVEIPVGQTWYWQMATFFYEFCCDLVIFAVLILLVRRHRRRDGDVFLWYLLLYAAARAVIEGLRSDSLTFISDFVRISQVLSGVILLAVILCFFLRIRDRISLVTLLPVLETVLCIALCTIGEFERGAYSSLFKVSQLVLILTMAGQAAIVVLWTFDSGAFDLATALPPMLCALMDALILLYGIGRADEDNTYYVTWRQIAAMLQVVTCGWLLYSPLSGKQRATKA